MNRPDQLVRSPMDLEALHDLGRESEKGDSPLHHLQPSELGTKEYWEAFYKQSLDYLSANVGKPDSDNDDDDDGYEEGEEDDPGTSWFSEYQAPQKVLQFLTSRDFPLAPCYTTIIATTAGINNDDSSGAASIPKKEQWGTLPPHILDLGTGNGSMLDLLRYKGHFTGPMVGVDYSLRSVQLARELQRIRQQQQYRRHRSHHSAAWGSYESDANLDRPRQEIENEGAGDEMEMAAEAGSGIRFEEWDIFATKDALSLDELSMKERLEWFPYERGGFDIVLDKGTFDAVSLSEEVVLSSSEGVERTPSIQDKRTTDSDRKGGNEIEQHHQNRKPVRICELYPRIVNKLVRRGGFLIVTSCNWTEDELIRWFTARTFPASAAADVEGEGQEIENKERQVDDGFYVWGRVAYPRFRFGGQEGQGVCTVCFQRKGG